MKQIRRFDFWSAASLTILGLFGLFLIYPLGGLLKEAVFLPEKGFTLDAFRKFFGKSYYYSTIFNSFRIALTVMFLCLLLGI
ncbi:MAG: iron ABC transporter permease, partial [Sphaerochaetaceae bacterium]